MKYLYIIGYAIVLLFIAFQAIDLIARLRMRLGLRRNISIILTEDVTIVYDSLGNELFRDKNSIYYNITFTNRGRIIYFGDTHKNLEYTNMSNTKIKFVSNFLEDLDFISRHIDSFWYQYITWFALKSKRVLGMSSFIIVAVSIDIQISSDMNKYIIKTELKKLTQLRRPRLYNLVDIR